MQPFGLIAPLQFLWEHGIPSSSILALGLLLSLMFLSRRNESHQDSDAPATLPRFSLFHIAPFLKRRHDFFAWGFKATNQRLFQFGFLRVCQTSTALVPLTFH